MMDDKPVRWHVDRAEHYIALGQSEVYLSDEASALPWEYVVAIEGGGLHRLSVSVSASFKAKHPCGLGFRWSFDYEDRDANGTGTFKIDVPRIRMALRCLPPMMRAEFASVLAKTVAAVRARAAEFRDGADRQEGAANALSAILAEYHTTAQPQSENVPA